MALEEDCKLVSPDVDLDLLHICLPATDSDGLIDQHS
jgi:hypothetical protein